VFLDIIDSIGQSCAIVMKRIHPGFLRTIWVANIHVRLAMSRVKSNDRLPFFTYHGQVLHSELGNLTPLYVHADPYLIFISQNDLESFASSLSATISFAA